MSENLGRQVTMRHAAAAWWLYFLPPCILLKSGGGGGARPSPASAIPAYAICVVCKITFQGQLAAT